MFRFILNIVRGNWAVGKAAICQAVVLAAVALIPAVGAGVFHPKRPDWRSYELSFSEISKLETVLWVDGRAAKEYHLSHIPGALLLNEDDWDGGLPAVLQAWSPGCPIVVYGGRCQTSGEVARRLRKEVGFDTVYVLEGNWKEWMRIQKP